MSETYFNKLIRVALYSIRAGARKGWVLLTVLLSTFLYSKAQDCDGTLGSPAVNITFGAGEPQFGKLPDGVTTTLQNQLEGDGIYAVINRTGSTLFNEWHYVAQDHTPGEENGYMMLVAPLKAGDLFYRQQITGLCPDTYYEFAAWILNVYNTGNGIDPDITFRIETPEGVLLREGETGAVSEGKAADWKQFNFPFKTGADTGDIVLIMRNNVDGGSGNDFLLDDITFQPCGPAISLAIGDKNETNLTICPRIGKALQLKASVSSGSPRYQWEIRKNEGDWDSIPNSNSSTYNYFIDHPIENDTYDFRVKVSVQNFSTNKCSYVIDFVSDFVSVHVNDIVPNLQAPSEICPGETLNLSAAPGGERYRWTGPSLDSITFDSPHLSIPEFDFSQAGKYFVELTSPDQCSIRDSVTVSVIPRPEVILERIAEQVCEGGSVKLNASGGLGVSYHWSPAVGLSDAGISNPLANPITTTRYMVVATNAAGCTDSGSVTVKVINKLVPNAGPDKTMVSGNPIKLYASVKGENYTVKWLPEIGLSDPTSLEPVVNAIENTTYTLTVRSKEGDCEEFSDTVNFRVLPALIIPNAFTPNGDGINDNWHIIPLDTYPEAIITVYNRNGRIVFRSVGYTTTWNARVDNQDLPTGTYYYTIYLKKNTKPLSGNVLIAR